MSWACDSAELVPGGWLSSAYEGHGVLAQNIPSDGGNGPSALFGCVTLPADNGVEIRALITRLPAGDFSMAENGAFTYSGVEDYFEFLLFADGVPSTTNIGFGPGISRILLTTGVGGVFAGAVVLADDTLAGAFGVPLPLSNSEMRDMYRLVMDLARIHGLISGEPLTVTPTSRQAGAVVQSIAVAGDVVTVERA